MEELKVSENENSNEIQENMEEKRNLLQLQLNYYKRTYQFLKTSSTRLDLFGIVFTDLLKNIRSFMDRIFRVYFTSRNLTLPYRRDRTYFPVAEFRYNHYYPQFEDNIKHFFEKIYDLFQRFNFDILLNVNHNEIPSYDIFTPRTDTIIFKSKPDGSLPCDIELIQGEPKYEENLIGTIINGQRFTINLIEILFDNLENIIQLI